MNDTDIVFLSACRTPIAKFNGALKSIKPRALGQKVINAAVKRSGAEINDFEHVVMGNVIHTDNSDMYISRASAIDAGLPNTAAALTVNRLCGSGMQAIISTYQLLKLADCDLAVAGGVECMSRAPYWSQDVRFGAQMGNKVFNDPLTGSLTCPITQNHMGVTAENIAEKYSINREEQDKAALLSQQKAQRAVENGYFEEQIVAIPVVSKKSIFHFSQDEHIRFDAKLADLEKLPPVFKKQGSVTAGNSSGLNDGAAALVMSNHKYAQKNHLTPLAKMVDYAFVGVEPEFMGIGPVPAVRKLLQKAGLAIEHVDVWEINEAFAAQAVAVCKELKLDINNVNPNGSGISLGHPIGATGAIIAVKAIHELKRTNGRFAVATMCIGGGQGIAILIENIK